MARSLNRVQLIGNLTRDPELRYTPQGTAVCTFGLATNRQWVTDAGEKKEEVEYHRIVAWNKLAELCAQLLSKGRKVFVEGRLQTRRWTGQDGQERIATEIVISDMIVLDSKPQAIGEDLDVPIEPSEEIGSIDEEIEAKESTGIDATQDTALAKAQGDSKTKKKVQKKDEKEENKDEDEDIPF